MTKKRIRDTESMIIEDLKKKILGGSPQELMALNGFLSKRLKTEKDKNQKKIINELIEYIKNMQDHC